MIKKYILIMLAAVLVITMVPAAYAADSTESTSEQKKHDEIREEAIRDLASQLQDKSRDPYDYEGGRSSGRLRLNADDYPAKFDLRDVDTDGDGKGDTSYITPVKFQNPFGSCWGFAAIAAAESSILSNKELNNDGTGKPLYSTSPDQSVSPDGKADSAGKTILDLSEKHLVYFAATAIDDPDDSQNGEGTHFLYPKNASGRMSVGGLPFIATSLFSSGIGPNLTSRRFPASSGKEGDMSDILSYRGKNGEIESRKVNGKWIDFSYSAEDEWGIDDEYRFLQSYKLKESYLLPSPAKEVADDPDQPYSEMHYEYDPDGTLAIKKQLMEGRAVQIGFWADTSTPDPVTKQAEYLNEDTWAQFTDKILDANHAVTIVGWDDDFDKNSFVDGKIPEDNGAWLVKNSWGTGERPFPYKGAGDWGMVNEKGEHTGYFWLSYYDRTISFPESLAFDRSNVGSEYYLDQYDFMPVNTASSGTTEAAVSTANMFCAEQAELLEQVSCQTSVPGTHVTYDVYLLTQYHRDPQDGIKVASEEADYEFGGFHKVTLKKPVFIQKGQYYSIVVTQTTPAGQYAFSLQEGLSKEVAIFFNSDRYQVGVINRNESFVCIDGQWLDLAEPEVLERLAGEESELMSFDNFPIKGYCTKVDSPAVIKITGDSFLSLLPIDNTCRLTARFFGASLSGSDPKIKWSVADDSEGIISVAPDDESGSSDSATVTARNYGKGFVTVEAEGIGTAVISIFVMKHEIMGVEFKDYISVFDYTGEPIEPEVTASCYLGCKDLKEGVDYEVAYSDNVNAGTATVTVTGIGDHAGSATNTFTIRKAANGLKASGRKVSVKASALRKKAVTVKRSRVIKVSGADGKLSFKKKSGSKKISVNKKTGKIKIAKGLKKGTYTIKILVSAEGGRNHEAAAIPVKAVIRVK
ncbi:MAG: hypothetical protein IKF07_05560 [Eubacterium sp.]|nr:hypothetical protein [Eubacterium sp.]